MAKSPPPDPSERLSQGLTNLARVMDPVGKPRLAPTPAEVIYRENKLEVLRYLPRAPSATSPAVLFVPSLINRHTILDLMEGKSLVTYLLEQGLDVYMVVWGTPGDEDRYVTFDHHLEGYLRRIVRKVRSAAPSRRLCLAGYCMGGTLTTIFTALHPDQVDLMVNIAAPINFHDDGLLSVWTRPDTFPVDALVDGYGNIPWPLLQSSFQMLKPTLQAQRLVYFLENMWDDQFVDGFVAMDAWANDNVSFPGEMYRKYIKSCYQDNGLVKGTLDVAGQAVNLGNIRCPLLCLVADGDHIVPPDSGAIIADLVSSTDKQVHRLKGGHVGAIVSSHAKKTTWLLLANWLAQRA